MLEDLFGPADLIIASAFVCVVLAAVVWSRIQSDGKRKASNGSVRETRPAAVFPLALDWILAGMNFVIGILLGVALNGLIQLVAAGAWIHVLNLVVLGVALFLIVRLHDWLGERLLPRGIRPARRPGSGAKTSRVRRLGLPVGLAFGVVFAELGVREALSGWLL